MGNNLDHGQEQIWYVGNKFDGEHEKMFEAVVDREVQGLPAAEVDGNGEDEVAPMVNSEELVMNAAMHVGSTTAEVCLPTQEAGSD
jgi:hypothetical protein